jgi:hypothetical protein
MPLARLVQHQHCMFRRNGVKTHWNSTEDGQVNLREQLETLRVKWGVVDDSEGQAKPP